MRRTLNRIILSLFLIWPALAFAQVWFINQAGGFALTSIPTLAPGSSWVGTTGGAGALPSAATQIISGTASSGGVINVSLSANLPPNGLSDGTTTNFPASGICFVNGVAGTTEANGIWPCTVINSSTIQLTGSSYVNAYISGGSISVVNGGQTILGAAATSSGGIRLAVSSTSHMAVADTFTVGGVSGTVEANGQWQIIIVDATHVDLCTTVSGSSGSYICNQAPSFTNNYASGGAIGFPEPAIADFDDYDGAIIETTAYQITIGAAISNRGSINNVTCYLEPTGATGTTTITKQNINTFRATAPTNYGAIVAQPLTANYGWTVALGANGYDGTLTLGCDVAPVNGITRRIVLNLWENIAGQTGYVNRTTSTPIYVSSATGHDPAAANLTTYLCTDSTGFVATFSTSAGSCSSLTTINMSPGQPILTTSGGYVTAETMNINSVASGSFVQLWGSGLAPNLIGVTWTNYAACGTAPGTGTNPGSVTNPYATLAVATQCAAALTISSGYTKGFIVYADTTAPFIELPLRSGVGSGGADAYNTRLIEVLPCAGLINCSANIATQSTPYTMEADFRATQTYPWYSNAQGILFTDAIIDTYSVGETRTSGSSAVNWGAGFPLYELVYRNSQIIDSHQSAALADEGAVALAIGASYTPGGLAPANSTSTSGSGYYGGANTNAPIVIWNAAAPGSSYPTFALPQRSYAIVDTFINEPATTNIQLLRNVSGYETYTPLIMGSVLNGRVFNAVLNDPANTNCGNYGGASGTSYVCDYLLSTERMTLEPWTQTNSPYNINYTAANNVLPVTATPSVCGTAGSSCLTGAAQTTLASVVSPGQSSIQVASATGVTIGLEVLASSVPAGCLVDPSYSGGTTIPLTCTTSEAEASGLPVTFANILTVTGPTYDATHNVTLIPFNSNEVENDVIGVRIQFFTGNAANGFSIPPCGTAPASNCPSSGSPPSPFVFSYGSTGASCGWIGWYQTNCGSANGISPYVSIIVLNGNYTTGANKINVGDTAIPYEVLHSNTLKNGNFVSSPTLDSNFYIQNFTGLGARQPYFWQSYAPSVSGTFSVSNGTNITLTNANTFHVGDIFQPITGVFAWQSRQVAAVNSTTSLTIDMPFYSTTCSGSPSNPWCPVLSATGVPFQHAQVLWNFACVSCGFADDNVTDGISSQFQFSGENNVFIQNTHWYQQIGYFNTKSGYPFELKNSAFYDNNYYQIAYNASGGESQLTTTTGITFSNNNVAIGPGTYALSQVPGSDATVVDATIDALLVTATLKPVPMSGLPVMLGVRGGTITAGTPLFAQTLDGRLMGSGTVIPSPVVGANQP